jgi:hypothetical protein
MTTKSEAGTRVFHPVLGRGSVVSIDTTGEITTTTVQYDGGALAEYPGQSPWSSGHRPLLDRLDFGEALSALKSGKRVARAGWNSKGMWLGLVNDWHPMSTPTWATEQGAGAGVMRDVRMSPWIGMKTADGCFVPWLASQTDVLAKDWEVLEEVR